MLHPDPRAMSDITVSAAMRVVGSSSSARAPGWTEPAARAQTHGRRSRSSLSPVHQAS